MEEKKNNNVQIGQQAPQTEEDINKLNEVRRGKLKELQEAGKDPFKITSFD